MIEVKVNGFVRYFSEISEMKVALNRIIHIHFKFLVHGLDY